MMYFRFRLQKITCCQKESKQAEAIACFLLIFKYCTYLFPGVPKHINQTDLLFLIIFRLALLLLYKSCPSFPIFFPCLPPDFQCFFSQHAIKCSPQLCPLNRVSNNEVGELHSSSKYRSPPPPYSHTHCMASIFGPFCQRAHQPLHFEVAEAVEAMAKRILPSRT